jgi:hypothetical protein
MSNVIKIGIEKVLDTKFIFNDRGGFEVRNAYIFWRNFEGRRNQFGNDARNFNLAVTPEAGKILVENGWRVRERYYDDIFDDKNKNSKANVNPENVLYFINVKVNMNVKTPPIISLYSEFKGQKSKRALDIESIGELDKIEIEQCDLIVNAYESSQFKGKITGYLQKLNAIQSSDIEFGGRYDDWLDEERDCMADGTCSLDNND